MTNRQIRQLLMKTFIRWLLLKFESYRDFNGGQLYKFITILTGVENSSNFICWLE